MSAGLPLAWLVSSERFLTACEDTNEMHPPAAIAHTYTYTRDVLLHVCEALLRILHLDRILPIGHSVKDNAKSSSKPEEQWTMTVEPYVPRRASTSQPEQELPVTHEVQHEKRAAEEATAKPTRVDKLGDIVVIEQPEHSHLSLITSPHIAHVLPDKDVAVETPEVCESKPGHLERTHSARDVLADVNDDMPTKSLIDASSTRKLTKSRSADRSDDLDRVSVESNATDDTEDDRVRSLDKAYALTDERVDDNKRCPLEDKMPPVAAAGLGGRSDAAVAKSKTLAWPTSSSSEDDEFSLTEQFTSPRFMPTMGQATYFSM